MNVLIIENEKLAAGRLTRLLQSINPDLTISAILETVESSINWMEENEKPDLILMDIQLDDGLCFEIFETIHVDTPIIFTTAYDKYTLKAFKVNSVDYLLKPIDKNELVLALDKFKNLHATQKSSLINIDQLLQDINKQYKSRFLIKIGTKYRSVSINEIRFFYVSEKSTFLKTAEGRSYGIDYSLDKLQPLLDPAQFYRLNRNCLINISSIRDMQSYSSSRLQLIIKDETQSELFVVSRDKVSAFKKWMDK